MYDASDDSLWGSLETEIDGSAGFIANDVAAGDYYILTSTDIDNDNTICEYGELCEYYPRLSETATYFTVSDTNLTDYNIFVTPIYKYGGVNAASVSSNTSNTNEKSDREKIKSRNGLGKITINPIIPLSDDTPVVEGEKSFGTN